MISVQTNTIEDNGSSLLLMLASDELLAEQARVIAAAPEQKPAAELYITLMRSPSINQSPPEPPPFVELETKAKLVTDGNKTSIYIPVTLMSQNQLSAYAMSIETSLDVPGLRNQERIFHVSPSNLKGPHGESVASIWEYPWKAV